MFKMTDEELAQFVREHSVRADVRDGVVWGELVYTIGNSSHVFREWEPIGSTLGDVRSWLGY